MKRSLNTLRWLPNLLALSVLVGFLTSCIDVQQQEAQSVSGDFDSPQEPLPVSEAFESPLTPPTPSPTPRPTSTRPPEPPTRTPTPTFTPAPPTPTPEPLPTLIPGLQTWIYVTTGERGPELYRIQGSRAARVMQSVYRVNTPILWHSRVYVEGLYPSPDGKLVAVDWVYGEGGDFVSILDVNDGTFTSLFGEKTEIDQRAFFLDWSPDGNSVLVLGGIGNPDFGGNVWLVDVNTRVYRDIGIKQDNRDVQEITDAAFSPDGKAVVYAQSNCYQCGSKVWRVALDRSDRQLLLEIPEFRVERVLWSPDGRYIAFTQWRESTEAGAFVVGELWVMDTEEGEKRLLSPVMTGYFKKFGLAWSPTGLYIAFIMSESSESAKQSDKLSSNIFVADVLEGEVSQLTHFQDTQVLGPTWSPDGSLIAFVASWDSSLEEFVPWVVASDARDLYRLGESAVPVISAYASNPAVVWLPEFLPGGQR